MVIESRRDWTRLLTGADRYPSLHSLSAFFKYPRYSTNVCNCEHYDGIAGTLSIYSSLSFSLEYPPYALICPSDRRYDTTIPSLPLQLTDLLRITSKDSAVQ